MQHREGIDFKYLIVNDDDRHYGLWVNTVGYQQIAPGKTYPLREHPQGYYFNTVKGRTLREFQLVYITKGRGLFTSDSTPERHVYRGKVMLLFPGQWHTYRPFIQTGWDEYYIGFEGPVVDNLLKEGFISPANQLIEVGLNEELIGLFQRALQVAEADKVSAQQYLAGIVLHMLGLISAVSKNKFFEMSDMERKIEQAKVIMSEQVENDIDAEEISMRLGISYSWFRKMFKDYTGYAPAKYFQALKLRRAKQLLLETSLPVKEIAYRLNFCSTEYFFNTFKRATGQTPTEYRGGEATE